MKLKVGFIYGGISTEHEISIISAIQAINNMNMDKYDIVPIYLSKKGVFYTGTYLLNIDNYKDLSLIPKKCKEVSIIKKNNDFVLLNVNFPHKVLTNIDIFFPIVHGYNTEDGSIAGFLETIGAPYAESDLYASLIGQDKVIQKMVFKENGINIAPYTYFYENEYLDNENEIISKINKLSYPVIVKPARLGSSVGINIALDESSLNEAINEALKYGQPHHIVLHENPWKKD
jgi:D-alanine-D-alanine ligase